MIEHPDYWELPFHGLTVTRCMIDFRFSLHLDQGHAVVSVSSFVFSTTARSYYFDPEKNITDLGPALAIFQKQIVDARAYKNGELDIFFSDGSRIFVKADPQYEAWELAGKHKLLVVSRPGGGLAYWLPKPPAEAEQPTNITAIVPSSDRGTAANQS